ncbi:hypothetical protein L873DRAFT_74781 [Choiromyces venosus 120613-1]|uniref:Uncharacterized protein n=1 Tax=Choiromyces venosus 120613-1 TaxID=1336337 RepID=A0A3N4J897_9PEZI|nr:hypothetical protein L873DRAFT_74781 [Choiromyces venosus 120613-1]
MRGSIEIFGSFCMFDTLDNIMYSHTWLVFRLCLYTLNITTARICIMYFSLSFHDCD